MDERAFATRFQALQLANAHPNQGTLEVVQRAAAYADFLLGETPEKECASLSTAQEELEIARNAVEPGAKRKRRTKEQIEADALASKNDAPEEVIDRVLENPKTEAAQNATQPVIEYKTLQMAVMKLVQQKGKEPALAILDQFGVSTALDLKPEQYVEALSCFDEALSAEASLA